MPKFALAGAAGVVVMALAPPVAADPPDPHMPDMTRAFCPGGHWGDGGMYGSLGVCDGEKYPDKSYWHQWVDNGYVGIGVTWHYDCVGDGNAILPPPPPPGGCGGAIPGDPPAAG